MLKCFELSAGPGWYIHSLPCFKFFWMFFEDVKSNMRVCQQVMANLTFYSRNRCSFNMRFLMNFKLSYIHETHATRFARQRLVRSLPVCNEFFTTQKQIVAYSAFKFWHFIYTVVNNINMSLYGLSGRKLYSTGITQEGYTR